jgi:hypothetical protein
MGGFFLAKREKDIALDATERQYSRAVDVFHKKGLPLNKKLVTPDYIIYVFHKYRHNGDNTLLYENGDFVVCTGTMFYNGRMGDAALQELYADFSVERQDFFLKSLGNYCFLINKGESLYLVNSPTGIYRAYSNRARTVISTSFLAVLNAIKKRDIQVQEFYEYLFDGACYDDETLIKDLILVNSRKILQLSPEVATIPQKLNFRVIDNNSSFDEMVNEGANSLIDYYTVVKENFGNSVCAGLTAGMDTRLMLACMRNVGIEPHLYIYGNEDSTNVKIAKMIAAGEGLNLEVEEKSKFPVIKKDEYLNFLENQHYMIDGLGNYGIFGNGSDISSRLKRVEKARLQLNGVDGLLRFYFSLPDKPVSIKAYLQAKHDGGDYSMCRKGRFKKSLYFFNLSRKTKHVLNVGDEKVDRLQLEYLVPFWRTRFWTGFNHMINNQLSDALCPAEESRLNYLVGNIPYKYKYLGIYMAAIIRLINPAVAKYASQYGHNFYDYDKIPLKRRIMSYLQYHTPPAWRPFLRAHYWRQEGKGKFPYYLTREYLDVVFPSSDLIISEFVDTKKISDRGMLSRALTVELLLTERF